VREVCNQLVNDPEYREALRRRLINGTAGMMEAIIWAYAYGRPVARVETGQPGTFAQLSNAELKAAMAKTLRQL